MAWILERAMLKNRYPGQFKEKNWMRKLEGYMFPLTIGNIAFSGS